MPDSLSNKTTFEVEVGWDILSGTGVTTALKIVHWPTTFPTKRYSFQRKISPTAEEGMTRTILRVLTL